MGEPEEDILRLKKKVCLLGDGAVGKTSLIRRYVHDQFDDKYITTLGAKTSKKVLKVKDKPTGQKAKVTMMIWDLLGQRGISLLHNMYYQNAKGALLVCDYTRKPSLISLKTWRKELFEVAGKVPLIILVNKCDLTKQYAYDIKEVKALAEKWGADYCETSAKTGVNVEEAFARMASILVRKSMIRKEKKEKAGR